MVDWLNQILEEAEKETEDEKSTGWKFVIVGALIYIGTSIWHHKYLDDITWLRADPRRVAILFTTITLCVVMVYFGAAMLVR